MQIDRFLICEKASIREALILIQSNQHGFILTADPTGVVSGLATDGDIRMKLLENATLDDAISLCANAEFVWERPSTPRETLMKRLDNRIRVIPLLDDGGRLVNIVTRDNLPVQVEETVYARARSPVRISFCGGGSDLTHYFSESGGAVINTAISLYSHATLRVRNDKKIIIQSLDLNETLSADNIQSFLTKENRLGLIQALLKTIQPDFGFELYLHSDYPMNSGLGGPAVVSATTLGCFNQFRRDHCSPPAY